MYSRKKAIPVRDLIKVLILSCNKKIIKKNNTSKVSKIALSSLSMNIKASSVFCKPIVFIAKFCEKIFLILTTVF